MSDTAHRGARLRGTWYILPTPFAEDGSLDRPSLGRLVEACIAWGVDGLTVLGVMGEPGSLTRGRTNAGVADGGRRRAGPRLGRRRVLGSEPLDRGRAH